MTKTDLLAFLRKYRLAVVATQSSQGRPQAALVGIAVTDQLEIVFDTVKSTRKWANLKIHREVSIVVGGWDGTEITAQLEGTADEPQGEELARLKEIYFQVYPDGRDRQKWEGITYIRVRPTWIRYSDFSPNGTIVEFKSKELV